MRISRIKLKNFMAYDSAEVVLPERGVVIVTGANGEGKSSLKDAVAAACWGRTLRRRPFWRSGVPCTVDLEMPGVTIRRRVTKGGSKRLELLEEGDEKVRYSTTKEAQQALSAIVPEMDLWRRCHVFSTKEAAAFSTATDKTRKQLLESLLGISRFDQAAASAKADHMDLQGVYQRAEHIEQVSRSALREREHARQEAQGLLQDEQCLPDEEALRRAEKKYERWWDEAQELMGRVSPNVQDLRAEQARLSVRISVAQENVEFLSRKVCPTCHRDMDDQGEELERVKGELERMRGEEGTLRSSLVEAQKSVDACAKNEKVVGARLEDTRQKLRELAFRKKQLERAQLLVERVEEQIAQAQGTHARAFEDLERARVRLGEIEAVRQVLGLTGVRATVLGRALGGLQELANSYVQRMFSDLIEVRLDAQTNLKGGGTADRISLEVDGLADGLGYEALSDGERCRVDVSILLSLARISSAALGQEAGTLWLDELFKSLDEEGIDAATEIVREIGEERPVVVISHHQPFVEHLSRSAALRLHVQDHQIKEV